MRAGGAPSLIRNDETFSTEAFAKDMGERCARQFCNGVNLKWTPKTKTSEEQLVMSFNDPAMAMVYETHLGHLGPRAPIDECALREFLAVELRHAVAEKGASEDRWAQGSKKKTGAKVNRLLRDLRSGAQRPASIGDSNNKGTVLLDDSPKHFVRVGGVVYARRQGLESAQRACRRQYVEVANQKMAELEEKPPPDTTPSWLDQRADLITGRNKMVVGDGGLEMHMRRSQWRRYLLHDPTAQRAEGADGGCAKGDPQPALYPGHNGAQGPSTCTSLRALRHAVSTSRSAGVGITAAARAGERRGRTSTRKWSDECCSRVAECGA